VATALTEGIRVTVESRYLAEHSDPDENRYAFAYFVTIANEDATRAMAQRVGMRGFSLCGEREGSRASMPQNPTRAQVDRRADRCALDETRGDDRRSAYQRVRLTQVVRRHALVIFRIGKKHGVASRFVTPPRFMSLLRALY